MLVMRDVVVYGDGRCSVEAGPRSHVDVRGCTFHGSASSTAIATKADEPIFAAYANGVTVHDCTVLVGHDAATWARFAHARSWCLAFAADIARNRRALLMLALLIATAWASS